MCSVAFAGYLHGAWPSVTCSFLKDKKCTNGGMFKDKKTCSLHFSIHCFLQQCHSQSGKVETSFPQKNLIMRKIHIGENAFYSHGPLAYSIQKNVFYIHRMILVMFFLFNSYFLNVTVTDPDGLNSSKTVNINIINTNDERPYFTTWVKIFHCTQNVGIFSGLLLWHQWQGLT